jgi:echinoderm microtubule-associated protein-like 5
VCRSCAGAPVSEKNKGDHDKTTFPWKPRAAYKKESADGVAGAGFLATADDFSFVKLFSYPVVADDAPYRAYRGHSSHVMCVRFSKDDRKVCFISKPLETAALSTTCARYK